MIRNKLNIQCDFVNYPVGLEETLSAILDVVKEKKIIFNGDRGEIVESHDPNEDESKIIKKLKISLFESLAQIDEEFENLYLEETMPTEEQFR